MNLKVTLIQSDLHWQNIEANLAMFEEKIWQIEGQTDLIILPEMFNTGFSMEAEKLAEVLKLKTFKWLEQMAAQTKSAIMGSYIVKENQAYFNRLVLMQANGAFDTYDKRHLFRMAKEHHTFTGGSERLIKNINGWKVMPLICYDLRFPVWSRSLDLAYDVLVYIANWPKSRNTAWKSLLQARAIENLSYCVGLNRVGKDGNGIDYSGDSAVIDFKGNYHFKAENEECITTVELSKIALEKYRKKFPAHLDADKFIIEKDFETQK